MFFDAAQADIVAWLEGDNIVGLLPVSALVDKLVKTVLGSAGAFFLRLNHIVTQDARMLKREVDGHQIFCPRNNLRISNKSTRPKHLTSISS